MASAGWNGGKAKSTQQAKAWMRHNSKEERIEANHSNTDIDKSRTPLNWSYRGLSYKARCAAYDKRMSEIDQGKPGTGKNTRTVLQAVTVYAPKALRGDLPRLREWFGRVGQIAEQQFHPENVIDMAVDVDEVHDYTDEETLEERLSVEHGHLWMVPEVDGRLNGKAFSARKNIVAFNDAVQHMTALEFGCEWNDGTKKKRRGTVERLKAKTLRVEVEQLEEYRDTIIADAMDRAAEITTEARRDARATRLEADQDREQARRDRNAAWWEVQDADEYARTTRARVDQDAAETTAQAEREAQAIRDAAQRDAERMAAEAEAKAQAVQEAIRQRIRAEVDQAKQERDQAVTARRAAQAALQGDFETWAANTPRPSATALLGVLGAAVRASREQPPKNTGVGAAWEQLQRLMAAQQAKDANRGPSPVEGPTR